MKTLLALMIVMTPDGWQPADTAQTLQKVTFPGGVLTQAFVSKAELGPSDVIRACNVEQPIAIGASCPESARSPRKDVFWRMSEVFTLPEPGPNPEPSQEMGAVRVTFNVPAPIRFADDGSVVPDGVPIYMRVYENDVLIASVPWAPIVSVARAFPQDETRCYYGGLWVDGDKNGKVDVGTKGSEESRTKNDACTRGLPIPEAGPSTTPQAPAAPIIEALKPGEQPPAQ
jgi:hypothetical protein